MARGTNPPVGAARKAPSAAVASARKISSLAVSSADTRALAATSTKSNTAELEGSVGSVKWRGPGQSVPNRYPGSSQSPATSTVRTAADIQPARSWSLTLAQPKPLPSLRDEALISHNFLVATGTILAG